MNLIFFFSKCQDRLPQWLPWSRGMQEWSMSVFCRIHWLGLFSEWVYFSILWVVWLEGWAVREGSFYQNVYIQHLLLFTVCIVLGRNWSGMKCGLTQGWCLKTEYCALYLGWVWHTVCHIWFWVVIRFCLLCCNESINIAKLEDSRLTTF